MRKLNQVIAVEKGIKSRANSEWSALDHIAQKAELLNGFSKTYQPSDDDGTQLPPQSQRVQYAANDILDSVKKSLVELFDVCATKDWGNQLAKADVVVDGETLLTGVPATYLLFLDKQLTDLGTFVARIVELDPSVDWQNDPTTGQFRSDPVQTTRTEKKQKALILYQATDKHPAQTMMITEDSIVGHWTTVRHSGAIPAPQKKALAARIVRLAQAVKSALEQANMVEVSDQSVGARVFKYIFG